MQSPEQSLSVSFDTKSFVSSDLNISFSALKGGLQSSDEYKLF